MRQQDDGQFLKAILSSVADGVFTTAPDRRITSFNRAAERITGVRAEQAVGRLCSEVLHCDLCEHQCPLAETLASGQEIAERRATVLSTEGDAKPISLSTAALRSQDGHIEGAVECFRDLSMMDQLEREVQCRTTCGDIVGRSPALQRVLSKLPDIAQSEATVLLEGPTGTGKELLARAVHHLSPRQRQPFVVVDCGALPQPLFESELFGYRRGAFTDATHDKPGRIALAEGGTVLFDEIGELPLSTQVKLLRLLQQREYEPLGGVRPLRADVRVIAATNRDLLEEVRCGRFRDDLYFRLAVVRLSAPPLSERREDIPCLARHFITRFNAKRGRQFRGLTPAALDALLACDLPGNVRQLENIIEHAFVLGRGSLIDVTDLPEDVQPGGGPRIATPATAPGTELQRAEAQAIRSTLACEWGKLGNTARELGISRTTLWRKMKRYRITAEPYRQTAWQRAAG